MKYTFQSYKYKQLFENVSKMFGLLPVELIEHILLYLSVTDIASCFTAFNEQYNLMSNYFWRKLCIREDFNTSFERSDYYKCFQTLKNKTLGLYKKLEKVPSGTLKYIYFDLIIIKEDYVSSFELDTYYVYKLECNNTFKLVQQMTGFNLTFVDEFIIENKSKDMTNIYSLNAATNEFSLKTCFLKSISSFLGISESYCLFSNPAKNCFSLCKFADGTEQEIQFPSDTKMLFRGKYCRLTNNIVVSILSLTDDYRIKVFNITSETWILDLMCFSGTGITNNPEVWVDVNFIGSCDVSYRGQRIYYGPFKVWDKTGKLILQTDIEPSTKYFLKCFLKKDHIILTTSDKSINSFNKNGELVAVLQTSTAFKDVKVSCGYLLFLMLEYNESVEIYDWRKCCLLYSISLDNLCISSMCSDYLYCSFKNKWNNKYDLISFV